jgi:hypothetical protein
VEVTWVWNSSRFGLWLVDAISSEEETYTNLAVDQEEGSIKYTSSPYKRFLNYKFSLYVG